MQPPPVLSIKMPAQYDENATQMNPMLSKTEPLTEKELDVSTVHMIQVARASSPIIQRTQTLFAGVIQRNI